MNTFDTAQTVNITIARILNNRLADFSHNLAAFHDADDLHKCTVRNYLTRQEKLGSHAAKFMRKFYHC